MKVILKDLLDKKDLSKQPLELRKICENIFSQGKGLRPQLVCLIGQQIGLSRKKQLFLSGLIESIHNSSLLHDDFIDHTKTRHKKKTAWLEFSPAQAVLAGDYLLAKVNISLSEEKNLELLNKTAQVICDLAKGEFLQRQLLGFKNKELKKRNHVHALKTSSLFKWCLQAPFIYQKRENKKLYKTLDQIGLYMGLLFQRADDLIDFNVRNKDQKPYLVDIKEKHFNSFACFLLEKSSLKQERQLKKAGTLSSVYKIFPDFKQKVSDFDALNTKVIKKTYKLLEGLNQLLKPKEQVLTESIKDWVSFLYWRTR